MLTPEREAEIRERVKEVECAHPDDYLGEKYYLDDIPDLLAEIDQLRFLLSNCADPTQIPPMPLRSIRTPAPETAENRSNENLTPQPPTGYYPSNTGTQ